MNLPRFPLLRIPGGARSWALIVVVVTAFWYCIPALMLQDGKPAAEVPVFWLFAYLAGPVICLLLVLQCRRVYVSDGLRHPWSFWSAAIVGLSSWVWVSALLLWA